MKPFSLLLLLCLGLILSTPKAAALSFDQLGFRLGKELGEPITVRSGEVYVLTEPFFQKTFDPPYGDFTINAAGALGVLRAEGDWSTVARLGPGANWSQPFQLPVTLRLDVSPTLMSQESLAGRKIGGIFHFTSGFQVDFDVSPNYALHYRVQHTSNGGLRRPNPGLDLHFIGLSRKL